MSTINMKMPVNARLVTTVFTRHKNTFYALKELINNSITAEAKNINIQLLPSSVSRSSINYHPIDSIIISDDGHGVPFSEFEKDILEIGTNNSGGNGVGRFSALQIGKKMHISTVAIDPKDNKRYRTEVDFCENDFQDSNLHEKDIPVIKTESTDPIGYCVTISNLYHNDAKNKKLNRKLGEYFKDADSLAHSLFEHYPMYIFKKSVIFSINDHTYQLDEFLNGKAHNKIVTYQDKQGKGHKLRMTFFPLKLREGTTKIFFQSNENGTDITYSAYNYKSFWYDNQSMGTQLVVVETDGVIREIYDDSGLGDLGTNEWKNVTEEVRQSIDNVYKSSNQKYISFVSGLHKDRMYPYGGDLTETGEGVISKGMFDQIVFWMNDSLNITSQNPPTRSLLYTLIQKAMTDGDLRMLIEHLTSLTKKSQDKLVQLLDEVKLDSLIKFGAIIAEKLETITLLNSIIYGNLINKFKDLDKVISNNLWIFGQEFEHIDVTGNKTELDAVLQNLHTQLFDYKATARMKNQRADVKVPKSVSNKLITLERPLYGEEKEILSLEILSPNFRLTQNEITALNKFVHSVKTQGEFPQQGYSYRIILLVNEFDDITEDLLSPRIKNGKLFLHQNYDNPVKIESYVIKWSELLSDASKKLKFLSNSLELKKKDAIDVFNQRFNDALETSKRRMYETKVV